MVTSIASTLGIGSGIDTAALIDQLAEASRAPKDAAITKREEANTAKISAIGEAASGIDAFASALSSLISGGTLFTQPTSSEPDLLSATAIAGARIGNLSAQIEVKQLAQGQSLASTYLNDITTAVGQGTLTLTTATGTFDIVIGADNDNLSGLARAINAAGAGVTAAVVEDADGARLTLKSATTGAAKAFSLAVTAGAPTDLSRFAFGTAITGGMTSVQTAQDAIVKLDGVEIKRSTNTFSDVIAGVNISLKKASPGTSLSLTATRPTEALKQAVNDFVSAYNELKTILDKSTAAGSGSGTAGPLRGDTGVRELQRQLARLTATKLSSAGGPSTLAELGVRTERDGTLTVDSTVLTAILASDPDGVEAMFNPGHTSSTDLVKVTSAMGRAKPGTYTLTDLVAATSTTAATGKIGGLDAVSAGERLVASIASPANGLVVELLGNVASATVTVDLGLGGALQAIRDQLLATSGPIKTTQTRLTTETTAISDDRARMEDREASYRDRLVKQFTAMDTRVAAYKSTQSFLEQQVKMWTNDTNA